MNPRLFPSRRNGLLRSRNRLASAFTLVETMIATGLITFSVVSVLGVLPIGLTSLRNSMDQTIEGQIIRSVGAQTVASSFDSLASPTNYYFDEEGQTLPDATGAYFLAKVTPHDPVIPQPTNGASTTLNSSLKTLRVELLAQPVINSRPARHFALQVANTGK